MFETVYQFDLDGFRKEECSQMVRNIAGINSSARATTEHGKPKSKWDLKLVIDEWKQIEVWCYGW